MASDVGVTLFTAGLPSPDDWPQWYYQDLQGQLQGPFDASTMSRWCSDNALPLDLKCCGVHPHDSSVPPTTFAHFQPLQKLLDNAEAGIQYRPVRQSKGGFPDEGPATPQSAVPAKGSRTAPTSYASQQQLGSSNSGSDVAHAADQRQATSMLSQQQIQNQGILQQQTNYQQQHQRSPQPRQQGKQNASAATSNNSTAASPLQDRSSMHQLHMQFQMQLKSAAASTGGADSAAGPQPLTPGSDEWNNALMKLLNREGLTGKEAELKWRVILASGDRMGPFTAEQMTEWLLHNTAPKGINKQQANQTATGPAALQVCGIMSADYNLQRLPGAKFFKPLGQLLPAIAAGMPYEAVNKHDLQRGIPKPKWNEWTADGASSATVSAAAAAVPGNKAGGQLTGKAAKAAARAAAAAAAGANGKGSKQNNSNNLQGPGKGKGPSDPSGPAGAAVGAAAGGLDAGGSAGDASKGKFVHPMALRAQQRQRQQQQQQGERLNAVAAAAASTAGVGGPRGQQQPPRGPGAASPMGPVVQAGKGYGGKQSAVPDGSASRGILMSASSMSGIAPTSMALQQQQQQQNQAAAAQAAALAAAAGRLKPGFSMTRQQQAAVVAAVQQQQQLQLQMQGLSVGTPTAAFVQGPQGQLQQALWFNHHHQQQQVPGQSVAGLFAAMQAGQGLLGYQVPGAFAAGAPDPSQASMAQLAANGQLARTSSTGSSALQQLQHPAVQGGVLWQQQQQQQLGMRAGAAGLQAAQGLPSAAFAQAAAALFLQQQQQDDPNIEQSQVSWWVQRSDCAYSGPFTGMQMYQGYMQQGALRFTDSTLVAAISGRDMPVPKAFVALATLLEAASRGYCLVPCSAKDAAAQQRSTSAAGSDNGSGSSDGSGSLQAPVLQVQQMGTGAIVALEQVVAIGSVNGGVAAGGDSGQTAGLANVSSGSQEALQNAHTAMRQQHGGMLGVTSPAAAAVMGLGRAGFNSWHGGAQVPASSSDVQGMRVQAAAAAGGAAVLPAGAVPLTMPGLASVRSGGPLQAMHGSAMLPAAATVGGISGLPGAQGVPLILQQQQAAAATAAADPLTVASTLLTAGNMPPAMQPVWYMLGAATEPHGAPKPQGPLEPADMLAMFKDGRLTAGSLVCAVHRGSVAQQQPPPSAFQSLQALLASTASDLVNRPAANAAAAMTAAAAAAGAQAGQLGGAVAQPVFRGSDGSGAAVLQAVALPNAAGRPMGQLMMQIPGSTAMVAVPTSMQLQTQMQQLQQVQQMAGAPVQQAGLVATPFVQQGGMLVPQHVLQGPAAVAALQQQQQPPVPDSRLSTPAVAGDGSSTGRSAESNHGTAETAAAAAAAQSSSQQNLAANGGLPRVDTWGSLAAAQDAGNKHLSTNSNSNQHLQQQLPHQLNAGAQMVEAALAANGLRRTSNGSYSSQTQGLQAAGAMRNSWANGPQAFKHSLPGASNYNQYLAQQQQMMQQMQQQLRRTSSSGGSGSSGRITGCMNGPASNGLESAAAAAAAAAAMQSGINASTGLGLPAAGYGLPMHYQQQQQQQQQQGLFDSQQQPLHQLQAARLAGMLQAGGMAGIPEHQQQLPAAAGPVTAAIAAPASEQAPAPAPAEATAGGGAEELSATAQS